MQSLSDSIPTSELSFYVFDATSFTKAARDFQDAFSELYSNTRVALSVKTNYLPALIRHAYSCGFLMEVVSAMEYEMVRCLGVKGPDIVVNGPGKCKSLLESAVNDGAVIQMDAPSEVYAISVIARRLQKAAKVLIRVNVAHGACRSRFGFDMECNETLTAIRNLLKNPEFELIGLHAHFCFPERRSGDYSRLMKLLISNAELLFGASPPPVFNIGGGFLSNSAAQFREQFPHPWTTFPEYAQAIIEPLRLYNPSGTTALWLEPGLAVDSECIKYYTQVLDIRTVGDRQFIQVAGTCYDVKPTKHRKNLPMRVIPYGGKRVPCLNADVVGNTCMEDDVLYSGFSGTLAAGDYLEFGTAGAYTFVLRPSFISVRPPVYEWLPSIGIFRLLEPPFNWKQIFKFCDE